MVGYMADKKIVSLSQISRRIRLQSADSVGRITGNWFVVDAAPLLVIHESHFSSFCSFSSTGFVLFLFSWSLFTKLRPYDITMHAVLSLSLSLSLARVCVLYCRKHTALMFRDIQFFLVHFNFRVTFGVLLEKSDVRKTAKRRYVAWDLTDLKGNIISLFLFQDVFSNLR